MSGFPRWRKDNGMGMRKQDLLRTLAIRAIPGKRKPQNHMRTQTSEGKSISSMQLKGMPAFEIHETVHPKEVRAPRQPKLKSLATAKTVSEKKLKGTPVGGTKQARRIVREVVIDRRTEQIVAKLSKMFEQSNRNFSKQMEERNRLIAIMSRMVEQSDARLDEQAQLHNRIMQLLAELSEREKKEGVTEEKMDTQIEQLQSIVNEVAMGRRGAPDFMAISQLFQ